MNERIRELRKALCLTLEKMGERLGVSKVAISKIENGHNNVTDQMFKSICREFNVNPEWLEHGIGEMFYTLDKEDELNTWLENVAKDKPDSSRRAIARLMAQLTEDDYDWLLEQAIKLADIAKEESAASKEYNASLDTVPDLWESVPDTPEELEALYPPVDISTLPKSDIS